MIWVRLPLARGKLHRRSRAPEGSDDGSFANDSASEFDYQDTEGALSEGRGDGMIGVGAHAVCELSR